MIASTHAFIDAVWPSVAGGVTGFVLMWGALRYIHHRSQPRLTRFQRKHAHLGWRYWIWAPDPRQNGVLVSPIFTSGRWYDGELRADKFDEGPGGDHGIYAAHYRADWMTLTREHPNYHSDRFGGGVPEVCVFGVVERYGKFVTGLYGWRAEHAVIRELMCKTDAMAEQLRRAYPGIKIGVNPLAFQ